MEGWELAKYILENDWHGVIQPMFPGFPGPEAVIKRCPYDYALKTVQAWQTDIRVGDVCKYKNQKVDGCFVVTRIWFEEANRGFFDGVWKNGMALEDGSLDLIVKTGEHIDAIADLFGGKK